jgi:hypothetical protein
MFLASAFVAVYALVATVSILIGLARFVLEAPGAIRADLDGRRRARAEPPRMLRYVRNEADDQRALPPG